MAKSAMLWFQSRLDAMTRDRDVALRVMWGPDCIKKTLNAQGQPTRGVPKYPGKDGKPVELWVVEQKLPDSLAKRDHARSRYAMVDQVVLSQCSRCDHEWERDPQEEVCPKCDGRFTLRRDDDPLRMVRLRTRIGPGRELDVLGEFPEEGIWIWFYAIAWHYRPKSSDISRGSQLSQGVLAKVISQFREKPLEIVLNEFETCDKVRSWNPDNQCCKQARERGEMCQGEFRQPDDLDLAYLEECVRVYDIAALDRNPDDPYGVDNLHQQTQKWIAAAAEEEAKQEADLRGQLAEALETGLRSRPNDLAWTRPIFDLGATKRGNQ